VTSAPDPLCLPEPALAEGEVRLRPWRVGDAAALAAAWADPEIACWTGVPPVRDEAAARRWLEGDESRRAARRSVDLVVDVGGQVAGEVGITGLDQGTVAEIGWWTGPDHRRRGLATTAVRLVAAWAVEVLGATVVEARCHPDNQPSGAVAHAAGFVLDDATSTPQVRVWRFEGGR
jgi:RimJ/RimL family protein N-acetyltransferase